MTNNIKFYSVLSICWFIVVWLVGVITDNVKLSEICAIIILVNTMVYLCCKIINIVNK